MTNEMIILNARFDLMQEGILRGTGNIISKDENGEKKQIEEPEQIHTYQGWKNLHRQVKRGEKSVATIQIWKHTTKKPKEADEEKQEKMFLTKAFFFTEAPDLKLNRASKSKRKLPQGSFPLDWGNRAQPSPSPPTHCRGRGSWLQLSCHQP